MQLVLRLILESSDWGQETIDPMLQKWAGSYLESEHSEDIWKYSVTSDIDPPLFQEAVIQIKQTELAETGKTTTILFEVFLGRRSEDSLYLPDAKPPPYHILYPQKIIDDIVKMGGWSRLGVPIRGFSKKVEFDDVEDWWDGICADSDMLPQVIVGSALSGELPVVEPDILASVLSGFANVHHASSLATMEKMSEIMGVMAPSKGSVRLLLSNPMKGGKQPLYRSDRLRGAYVKEDGGKRRRIRFEHDIFLRLANRALTEQLVPEYWGEATQISTDPVGEARRKREEERRKRVKQIDDLTTKLELLQNEIEKIENAYQNASLENEVLRGENSRSKEERLDLEEELEKTREDLATSLEVSKGWQDSFSELKEKSKEIRRANKESRIHLQKIMPILEKFRDSEGASNIDDFVESLNERLFYIEEEEEESPTRFDSVVSVVKHLREEKRGVFSIVKSAVESAEKSKFKFPRRVEEAFEMMEKSYDYILNRSRSGQSLNYEQAFRKFSDSVFGVANRERKATMESFGKQRVFEGREMQAHIKIGKSRARDKTIRIHFVFDNASERFIIGYCGRHLPTAGRPT